MGEYDKIGRAGVEETITSLSNRSGARRDTCTYRLADSLGGHFRALSAAAREGVISDRVLVDAMA